jgi:hypothetical protein
MFKNSANIAMDLKTFGNSNAYVNSDVLIGLDSGGNPTPGTNSGKIVYNINGLDNDIIRFRNKYNSTCNICIKCRWRFYILKC